MYLYTRWTMNICFTMLCFVEYLLNVVKSNFAEVNVSIFDERKSVKIFFVSGLNIFRWNFSNSNIFSLKGKYVFDETFQIQSFFHWGVNMFSMKLFKFKYFFIEKIPRRPLILSNVLPNQILPNLTLPNLT